MNDDNSYKINNTSSSEWMTVKEFTEEQIKLLHIRLEGSRSENETAVLRGKIAFAREILKLEENKTKIDVLIVDYES